MGSGGATSNKHDGKPTDTTSRVVDSVNAVKTRQGKEEKKQIGADHVDKKHHAAEKCIQEGDLVLLEKRKENKLSQNYEKEPYQVTARYGDQVQLKTPQGVEYKRNIQHVKRFVTPAIESAKREQMCGQEPTPSPEI
ncbi:hypothetical protein ACROYT_G022089 [Oculina patagonica]